MNELILNFHGLNEPPAETAPDELPYWLDRDAFETALDTLKTYASAKGWKFSITFDDGNISDARIALPALAARGMKAVFFICAGRIGKPHYLDASAIKDLLQGGMEIGSHGMDHIDWRATSDAQLDVEVVQAKQVLEQVSGRPVRKAGVPFGSYDRRVLAKLREADFQTIYTSDAGLARTDLWIKPRNTLERSFPARGLADILKRRNAPAARLYRFFVTRYKSLR